MTASSLDCALSKFPGKWLSLINAVTEQVPNGDPATVKLFMDLWDQKK